jgi:hypothetical protein
MSYPELNAWCRNKLKPEIFGIPLSTCMFKLNIVFVVYGCLMVVKLAELSKDCCGFKNEN